MFSQTTGILLASILKYVFGLIEGVADLIVSYQLWSKVV